MPLDLWKSPPAKLPPGTHGIAPELVAQHQRGRVLEAMASLVAERGYAETTIEAVVGRAGVSRTTLYTLFPTKDACFLAACGDAMDHIVSLIVDACRTVQSPHERLTEALAAFLRFCAEQPGLARMCLVDIAAAGRTGSLRRTEDIGRAGALAKGALAEIHSDLRARTPEMVVSALYEIVGARLVAGETDDLPELAPRLMRELLPGLGAPGDDDPQPAAR